MKFLLKIFLVILVLSLKLPSYVSCFLILLLVGYDLVTSLIKIILIILTLVVFFIYKGWGNDYNHELQKLAKAEVLLNLQGNQQVKIFADKIHTKDHYTNIDCFILQLLRDNQLLVEIFGHHAVLEDNILLIDKSLKINYNIFNITAKNATLNLKNSTLNLTPIIIYFNKHQIISDEMIINFATNSYSLTKPLLKLEIINQ